MILYSMAFGRGRPTNDLMISDEWFLFMEKKKITAVAAVVWKQNQRCRPATARRRRRFAARGWRRTFLTFSFSFFTLLSVRSSHPFRALVFVVCCLFRFSAVYQFPLSPFVFLRLIFYFVLCVNDWRDYNIFHSIKICHVLLWSSAAAAVDCSDRFGITFIVRLLTVRISCFAPKPGLSEKDKKKIPSLITTWIGVCGTCLVVWCGKTANDELGNGIMGECCTCLLWVLHLDQIFRVMRRRLRIAMLVSSGMFSQDSNYYSVKNAWLQPPGVFCFFKYMIYCHLSPYTVALLLNSLIKTLSSKDIVCLLLIPTELIFHKYQNNQVNSEVIGLCTTEYMY